MSCVHIVLPCHTNTSSCRKRLQTAPCIKVLILRTSYTWWRRTQTKKVFHRICQHWSRHQKIERKWMIKFLMTFTVSATYFWRYYLWEFKSTDLCVHRLSQWHRLPIDALSSGFFRLLPCRHHWKSPEPRPDDSGMGWDGIFDSILASCTVGVK